MKKYTIIIIAFVLVTACDPFYYCYIQNDTKEEIKVKFSPPIEDEELNFQPTIAFVSLEILDQDTFAIYSITPKSSVRFFGYLDFMPDKRHFPFNFLEVYSTDTLSLDNKESIINHLVKVDKLKFVIIINE